MGINVDAGRDASVSAGRDINVAAQARQGMAQEALHLALVRYVTENPHQAGDIERIKQQIAEMQAEEDLLAKEGIAERILETVSNVAPSLLALLGNLLPRLWA